MTKLSLKVVKVISQAKFEIMLGEDERGLYYIVYEVDEHQYMGDPIKDYGLASFIFDMKLQELEGH